MSFLTGQPRLLLIQNLISYVDIVESATDKLFARSLLEVTRHTRLEVLAAEAEAVTNAAVVVLAVVTVENVGGADDGLPVLPQMIGRDGGFEASGADLAELLATSWCLYRWQLQTILLVGLARGDLGCVVVGQIHV